MADDLVNALQQSNRSASVLQGIANPPQVNPLAAITAGNQAAEQSFRTDQAQMQTGAARSAIIAAQAMTVAKDGSDENLAASFANMRASGAFPPQFVDQEYARWRAMSPTERQDNAYRVGLSHLDQLGRVLGATTGVNTGGQIEPWTLTQPTPRGPGGLVRGPGAATTTLTPGEYMQGGYHYSASQADVDAGRATSVGQDVYVPGVVSNQRTGLPAPPGLGSPGGSTGGGPAIVRGSTGNPVSPANPPRLLNVPGQAPAAAPAAPAAPAPATGPRGDISPDPLAGGVQVASANPLQVPETGAPGQPNPLVPGDVAAIEEGRAQARATPRPPGTQTAWNTIATGAGAEEVQTNKASADRLAGDRLEATQFQQTQFPYVQALKNYGEGTKTGPGTDFWNQVAGSIRTPLAKLGMNIGPLSDTTERVDALGKWLANIQSGNPISAKSDAMLAQTLKGSASTHINEVAGEDQVKAGMTLLRMKTAAVNEFVNNPALQRQYGTYLNFLQNFNNTIDPRAFSVDMYNDAQKARLRAQLQSGTEEDAKRFKSTLDLARRNGMISGAGSQAMP